MNVYVFTVRQSDQHFASIVKVADNQVVSAKLVEDENGEAIYSVLMTDEVTARANFTLTGHLPSVGFEAMLDEAKGIIG
jgi:hypothetical protein